PLPDGCRTFSSLSPWDSSSVAVASRPPLERAVLLMVVEGLSVTVVGPHRQDLGDLVGGRAEVVALGAADGAAPEADVVLRSQPVDGAGQHALMAVVLGQHEATPVIFQIPIAGESIIGLQGVRSGQPDDHQGGCEEQGP